MGPPKGSTLSVGETHFCSVGIVWTGKESFKDIPISSTTSGPVTQLQVKKEKEKRTLRGILRLYFPVLGTGRRVAPPEACRARTSPGPDPAQRPLKVHEEDASSSRASWGVEMAQQRETTVSEERLQVPKPGILSHP